VYGTTAANFFLLFTASQFHLQFYLSRTLPNFLALPLVIAGLTQLISTDAPTATSESSSRRIQLGIGLLIAAGIIARSEIGFLCAIILLVDIVLSPSPKEYLLTVLPAGVVSAVAATAATVTVDTKLWSCPSFPELEALLFNVVEGHASDWGVQPWYYYLLSLPKLLLNPLSPMLLASSVLITYYTSISLLTTLRQLRYLLVVPVLFVSALSLLDHKEWRFIIYIVPLLTIATSISAAYIFHHRKDSRIHRFVNFLLVLSIPMTLASSLVMGFISSTNYPGAKAVNTLHELCNSSQAVVFLDIPTRMTGATLPLCTRDNWTYIKTENATLLDSLGFWQDIDYAIVGSLAGNPCKRGKGVEGKREWEILHCQEAYAGITWRPADEVLELLRGSTYVRSVVEDERVRYVIGKAEEVIKIGHGYVRTVLDNAHVHKVGKNLAAVQSKFWTFSKDTAEKFLSHRFIKAVIFRIETIEDDIFSRIGNNSLIQKIISDKRYLKAKTTLSGIVQMKPSVPWIHLEYKVFVLKHMRKEDLDERKRLLEEKREKEREGLGKRGEIEGQWRDFY